MSDIKNIKLGDSEPDSIMFDSANTWEKPSEFDYFKFSNDAGGYFVHGLWIAPVSPWGVYSWPWDLGVTSGGLKDVNNGSHYWGYVHDAVYKNLTSGMNKNFPENVKGNYKIAISVWFNTSNYTDDSGRACLDLGDRPIVITFLDNRFDNYNWVLQAGAVAEWSSDKKTCTIYRIPASSHCVFISDNNYNNIDIVRRDLSGVYADVSGLTYHYNSLVVGDPSSVECWDAHVGDEQVYHKDRTLENCWVKYGIANEKDWSGSYNYITSLSINMNNIPSDITSPVLPSISDLEEVLQPLATSDKKMVTWNCVIHNTEFWEVVKQYYATHPFVYINTNFTNNSDYIAEDNMKGVMLLFKDSNITGDIHLVFDGNNPYLWFPELFANCTLNKVTIELRHTCRISSGQHLFRKANIKEIAIVDENGNPLKIYANDISGLCEMGNPPKVFPDIIGNSCKNIAFAFSYCKHLVQVNFNLISPTLLQQAFQACSSLTIINGVINIEYMDSSKTNANEEFYKAFAGCTNLTRLLLTGLNGSVARLDTDEGIGNLENLDSVSIQYIIENVKNLTTYSEDADHSNNSNLPKAPHGDLYCPAKWGEYTDDDGNVIASKILDSSIAIANNKNWDVYIGGVKVELI